MPLFLNAVEFGGEFVYQHSNTLIFENESAKTHTFNGRVRAIVRCICPK